jgi:Flp pilus assembly protein TadG
MVTYRKRHRHRGVALVELALVLSILLTLSLLLVQYGIIMNTAVGLTNLSREGARYAAVNPANDQAIKTYMQNVCPPSIKWSNVQNNIVIWSNGTRAVGSKAIIRVTINYDMKNKLFIPSTLSLPLVPPIKIFSTTYSAQASMMIE